MFIILMYRDIFFATQKRKEKKKKEKAQLVVLHVMLLQNGSREPAASSLYRYTFSILIQEAFVIIGI